MERVTKLGTTLIRLRSIVGTVASNLHSPSIAPRSRLPPVFYEGAMKSMIEGNQEATKALALSGAGVLAAMLIWTLMMMLFY